MNLMSAYEAAIGAGDISNDTAQRDVIKSLQVIADALVKHKRSWFSSKKQAVPGMYLYGSVGVGKTYVIDLFYHCLPERKKVRMHFHQFMQQVDRQLRLLQGQKNPIQLIAKQWAKTTHVICFDEFMVHDVAYAMILAELLQALNHQGITLVISSNTVPDDLYLNGVQRARFLPAIALIKKTCQVVQLDKQRDYRLGRTPLLEAYLAPLNQTTQERMQQQFASLNASLELQGCVSIQNRDIPYIQRSTRAIWFDFGVICNLPRSQLDYLELANQFDTLFVSNIPILTEKYATQTLMFIHLIDVLYDQGIKLVLSAEAPAEQLYLGTEQKNAFKRTLSRLMEMQSVDYLSRHPRRGS